MSDRFDISASERGLVRLFALDLPGEEVGKLREADLAAMLGVSALDIDQVDLFSTRDLTGLGLSGYMTEGLGIPEAEIAPDRARLDALTGHLMVVRSAAFQGAAVTLTPRAPLRWIGTYTEEKSPVKFEPLPSAAAEGQVAPTAKPRPSDAAMSGRVAMVALLVIAVITLAMVLVAAS
ncbi:hypothetical protein EI983_02335 [Roseovarius faecimaris]|uniref:Aspartate carbamoyltransferase catalytic subunit n=1 Tax=Roseovarius faecimaris TaxID=2494550 RepID=A0A6I6IX17_9RHOB|nr:hypothetical protein [Roseovarius faecimaris]QGX97178.1 hypothetical protein EI983_02335 [Roseovarius faecimaris]